jgi:multiple sugar transport system substrate-binding protein
MIALWDKISTDPKFHTFPNDAYLLGDYEAQHTAVPRPLTPAYLQLEDIFASTYEDIRNGVDPKDALDGAAQRLDLFFAQFKR